MTMEQSAESNSPLALEKTTCRAIKPTYFIYYNIADTEICGHWTDGKHILRTDLRQVHYTVIGVKHLTETSAVILND